MVYERAGRAAVPQAERVLAELPPSAGTFATLLTALQVLLHAGRGDRVERWCGVLLERDEAPRVPLWRARLAAVRAEAALLDGREAGARQWAAEALGALEAADWGVLVGVPLSVLLRARLALGHQSAAGLLERLEQPEGVVRRGLRAALFLRARGHWLLEAGQPRLALADFRACGELATSWTVELPALVPWRGDCALALARLGDRAGARALAEEQLRMRGGAGPRVRAVGLRALAATARPQERVALLREAAGLLREPADAVELMPVLADLSAAYGAVGDAEGVRVCERQLLRAVAECGYEGGTVWEPGGMPPGAVLADGWFGPAGDAAELSEQEASLDEQLSAAERRVAQLAARGQSNRQISHLLNITVSTVEQHLTRVYRKLSVTRRSDLPAWLVQGVSMGRPAAVPAQWSDRRFPHPRRPHPAGATVPTPNA
ncbi:helix-turn-helix domain-containing protein [Actinacidiphila yeochonensis]|uniref:helix-turn-helix domain-containing protein n=1 Tax=Actinacidiphila yeochonensis TaxID=89050 RepID=UPI0018E2A098|nr:helix-turn-helix transcriptional regulator [Actinacidiphila yeochonensis]